MSHWSYLPLDDASSYYSYPDDFEFGSGDDDDTVFDLAWADMLTGKCRAVRFKGWMDSDKLEDAGAILSRSLMPALVESLPGADRIWRQRGHLPGLGDRAACRHRLRWQATGPERARAGAIVPHGSG